jgi:serine/threonine protein phosphatase PrpC
MNPIPAPLQWSALTHPGKVRMNNEDTFLALAFNAQELRFLGKTGSSDVAEQDFVFAVSDGMGGAKSGEFASKIATERITKLLPRSFRYRALGMDSGFQDILNELFLRIHQEMQTLARFYEECVGMGCTLSLGWITPGLFYFAHVGDSRIYYLPKHGSMQQITHDHNYVGWLRRQGQISEGEARRHPRRHVLQKALGADHQFVEPQIGVVKYEQGDRFLLCSDGLVDGLWDNRISALLSTEALPEITQKLINEAIANSGQDNLTALVVEIG